MIWEHPLPSSSVTMLWESIRWWMPSWIHQNKLWSQEAKFLRRYYHNKLLFLRFVQPSHPSHRRMCDVNKQGIHYFAIAHCPFHNSHSQWEQKSHDNCCHPRHRTSCKNHCNMYNRITQVLMSSSHPIFPTQESDVQRHFKEHCSMHSIVSWATSCKNPNTNTSICHLTSHQELSPEKTTTSEQKQLVQSSQHPFGPLCQRYMDSSL